jgi:hypothetical protein
VRIYYNLCDIAFLMKVNMNNIIFRNVTAWRHTSEDSTLQSPSLWQLCFTMFPVNAVPAVTHIQCTSMVLLKCVDAVLIHMPFIARNHIIIYVTGYCKKLFCVLVSYR